ncbi:MAG: ATP-binding protein [Bacteroidia bacterium]|nr:ATP-binding protein [Bacteroidia bacterium]
MKMLHKIIRQIATGENETLDFKQSISDASKIARTMVAFANNKGGTLLVGVRDNGSIAGIRNDDEKYMLELAAEFYCSPKIELEIIEHEIDRKIVLEAKIKPGVAKPYFAKAEDGSWWVYIRVMDKSLQASPVMYQVLKKQSKTNDELSAYSFLESEILNTLKDEKGITLTDLIKSLKIKRNRVIYSLAKLIHFDLVKVNYQQKLEFYTLKV